MPEFNGITIIPAYGEKEGIRLLFTEYTQYLVDNDPVFASYLELQNYDDELNDLEHKYGMPDGRLYIAKDGERPVGCIGFMRLDGEGCELKRLYVRPEYRGRGLARFLTELAISEAKAAGYGFVLLDTLPFLVGAQKLYESMGFYRIEKYNDSPMENAIYLRLDLK